MKVNVTFELDTLAEAVSLLGKVGDLGPHSVEAKPARKGRADKGQTRGEYKPRVQDGAGAAAVPAVSTVAVSSATENPGVTESGSATSAGPSTVPDKSATATPAPSSNPADVVKAEIKAQQTAQGTGFPEPTIGEKDAEVQAALEAIFGKFGIDKVRVLLADFGIDKARNLRKSKKADFLAAAKALVA